MLLEKQLAQTLGIQPSDSHIGDRMVASAVIFATLVGLATLSFKTDPVEPEPANQEQSIDHDRSQKEWSSRSAGSEYTRISPESMKAISLHIANKWRVGYIQSTRVVSMADEAAQKTNLDVKLILAVIAQESSFDPTAKSQVGAEGLMQVWRKWHHEKYAGINIATPPQNVIIGSSILREYLDTEKGDVVEALQRYNGNKKDATKNYASNVLTYQSEFERVNYQTEPQKPKRLGNF